VPILWISERAVLADSGILADAAAKLSGKSGGLNVVGSLRKSLGADVMRVEVGEGGLNVEVGKYLAEGVYVGTKLGTGPGSTGGEVKIQAEAGADLLVLDQISPETR
jgi:autotransporter translocation and assembly factor TamB